MAIRPKLRKDLFYKSYKNFSLSQGKSEATDLTIFADGNGPDSKISPDADPCTVCIFIVSRSVHYWSLSKSLRKL